MLHDVVFALSLIRVCHTTVTRASYEISAKFAQNFAEISQTFFVTFARRSHDLCAIFVLIFNDCDRRAAVSRLSHECCATVARRLHDGRFSKCLATVARLAIIPSHCHTGWTSHCWMLIWSLMRTMLAAACLNCCCCSCQEAQKAGQR